MPEPWFREGLRFSCTRCGDCCTGRPGYVWVTRAQIEGLARFLGISPAEVGRRYLRSVWGRFSLIEKAGGDCVFYEKGCTVYPARPLQCRTFPFWPENVSSERAWNDAGSECPGVGRGRVHGVDEILRIHRGEADASAG